MYEKKNWYRNGSSKDVLMLHGKITIRFKHIANIIYKIKQNRKYLKSIHKKLTLFLDFWTSKASSNCLIKRWCLSASFSNTCNRSSILLISSSLCVNSAVNFSSRAFSSLDFQKINISWQLIKWNIAKFAIWKKLSIHIILKIKHCYK